MKFEDKKQKRVSARASPPRFRDKAPSLDSVEKAVPSIIRAANARTMDIREWIRESPELALSVFMQGLLDGTPNVRVDSIIRIGLVFNEGIDISPVVGHILDSLSDSSEFVRYNAAGLLACYYLDYGRIDELRLLVKSGDIAIKTAAIESLGGDAEEGKYIGPLICDLVRETWNADRDVGMLAYMSIHNAAGWNDQQALRYISWITSMTHSEGFLVH